MKYLTRIEAYIWLCFLQFLPRANSRCHSKRASCTNYGCFVYLVKYTNSGCRIVTARCKSTITSKDTTREKYGEENQTKLRPQVLKSYGFAYETLRLFSFERKNRVPEGVQETQVKSKYVYGRESLNKYKQVVAIWRYFHSAFKLTSSD